MIREPVQLDARKSMSPARRKRILERSDGVCQRLGCDVRIGLQLDHVIPLALGGKDQDDNIEALCAPHHLAKTKLDVRMIAKAKRIERSINPETRKAKRPIRSRGWDKTKRRKFDGSIEERK